MSPPRAHRWALNAAAACSLAVAASCLWTNVQVAGFKCPVDVVGCAVCDEHGSCLLTEEALDAGGDHDGGCVPETTPEFCAASWDAGCLATSGVDRCGNPRTETCSSGCTCGFICSAVGGGCVVASPSVAVPGLCACEAECIDHGVTTQCGGLVSGNAGRCCRKDTPGGPSTIDTRICTTACCSGCGDTMGNCRPMTDCTAKNLTCPP